MEVRSMNLKDNLSIWFNHSYILFWQANLEIFSPCANYSGIYSLFSGGSDGKESACNVGDLGSVPGSGRSSGERKATHSSILAWRIPWTEEPGGLYRITQSDTTEGT